MNKYRKETKTGKDETVFELHRTGEHDNPLATFKNTVLCDRVVELLNEDAEIESVLGNGWASR